MDRLEPLVGVSDLRKRTAEAMLASDLAHDLRARHAHEGPGTNDPVHRDVVRMAVDGQPFDATYVADSHRARAGHRTVETPGYLPGRPTQNIVAVEQDQVRVRELDGDLVGRVVSVFVGEPKHTVGEIDRRAK